MSQKLVLKKTWKPPIGGDNTAQETGSDHMVEQQWNVIQQVASMEQYSSEHGSECTGGEQKHKGNRRGTEEVSCLAPKHVAYMLQVWWPYDVEQWVMCGCKSENDNVQAIMGLHIRLIFSEGEVQY